MKIWKIEFRCKRGTLILVLIEAATIEEAREIASGIADDRRGNGYELVYCES